MAFWRKILVLSAPAVLGGAVGWLTGQTGPDPTVVAAVISAMLTGIGGALLAFMVKAQNRERVTVYISAAVVLFTVLFVIGVYFALFMQARAAHDDRIAKHEVYAEAIEFRRKSLEECSRNEYIVNRGRNALRLPPLPPEVFCDVSVLK